MADTRITDRGMAISLGRSRPSMIRWKTIVDVVPGYLAMRKSEASLRFRSDTKEGARFSSPEDG
jgi:hypothetical protein